MDEARIELEVKNPGDKTARNMDGKFDKIDRKSEKMDCLIYFF